MPLATSACDDNKYIDRKDLDGKGECVWVGLFSTVISFFDSEQPILLTLHTQPQQYVSLRWKGAGVKMVISVGSKKQKKGGGCFRVFAADLTYWSHFFA